jgi:PAS domain S-box-containing protein
MTPLVTAALLAQAAAFVLSLRLIHKTGRRPLGAALALMALLMVVRRALTLLYISDGSVAPDLLNESAGLLASVLLAAAIVWLTRLFTALDASEQSLRERTEELFKRVKELDSLYALACLSEQPGITIEGLLQGLMEILPGALQYPERTEVRITMEGREFKTPRWERGPVEHVENVLVEGENLGRLSVCYRAAGDGLDLGFLDEERRLLHLIATRLGRLIAQMRAQSAVQRERDFAESLIETAQAIVLVLDMDGRIVRFNRYMEEVSGYTLDEVAGKDWFSVFLPERNRERGRAFFRRIVADDRVHANVDPILMKNRTERLMDWYGKTLRDPDGQPTGMLVVGHDITERKEAEQEMKLREQQLAQADKMASLGVLVSGVAHEINNPNHFVMMSISMLAKAWDDTRPILEKYYEDNGDFLLGGLNYSEVRGKVPVMMQRVMEGSERIRTIVQELRDFARQPTSELTDLVDVNEVVRSTMVLLHNMLKHSTSRFTVRLADDVPNIRGNFRRLEQVVVNLVQNACQALPDTNRAVGLSTAYDRRNARVLITVRDEGVGIPEEHLNRIMDPFFTTKRESGGTGLGLSIASSIVKEHGGKLVLDSAPGRGTTATVTLPAGGA